MINYGDDNIDCDGGNNEGDNDEEAENDDKGGNDEEAENEDEGCKDEENEDEGGNDEEEGEEDGDNGQSGDENEQGNEDDSDDEDGDEGADEDYDDIDGENYKGELYDDDESDDDSLKGGKYRVPSARGKGAGRKPHPDRPPKPNTYGMTEAEASNSIKSWELSRYLNIHLFRAVLGIISRCPLACTFTSPMHKQHNILFYSVVGQHKIKIKTL